MPEQPDTNIASEIAGYLEIQPSQAELTELWQLLRGISVEDSKFPRLVGGAVLSGGVEVEALIPTVRQASDSQPGSEQGARLTLFIDGEACQECEVCDRPDKYLPSGRFSELAGPSPCRRQTVQWLISQLAEVKTDEIGEIEK